MKCENMYRRNYVFALMNLTRMLPPYLEMLQRSKLREGYVQSEEKNENRGEKG